MPNVATAKLQGYADVGGHPALDLVNTMGWRGTTSPQEMLVEADHLIALAQALDIPGASSATVRRAVRSDRAAAERGLERVRDTREALHRVLHPLAHGRTPSSADLADLAVRYGEAVATSHPTVTAHGLRWTWPDAPPWDRLVNHAVVTAVDLLHTGADRVKQCGESSCGWLFLDQSKNASRRWCSMEICGSRTKMRRHYARTKTANATKA